MSAIVFATSGPFRFQGWCDLCQDGQNGGREACETWAFIHNSKKHPPKDTK